VKPSDPVILNTLVPSFISLHAVSIAAAIELHFTGIETSVQKIEYVTTLGNLLLVVRLKTHMAPSILNRVTRHALREKTPRYLCSAGLAFPFCACAAE
jgi:hypothetical protein